MGNWNHCMCEECWTAKHPDRAPVKMVGDSMGQVAMEVCCFCGKGADGNIWVRADPDELSCKHTKGRGNG